MKSFLGFLLSSPSCKAIKDEEEIAKQYQYWRVRIFYSIYLGYSLFYFTRKSVTFVLPFMEQDLNFTKAELGLLSTILYLSYGVSKFAGGIISDKANPRYFMALGLMATGIFNIAFGLSSPLLLFSLFWLLNGLFQGCGWPPCTKQLTHWFSQKERGFWWSLGSTSHNLGGALIPLFIAFIAQSYNWRVALYATGGLTFFAGFWLINRLRDTPQSMGLPPVEEFNKDEQELKSLAKNEKEKISFQGLIFKQVLTNPKVYLLAFSYLFVYIVRSAFNDWGVFYLHQTKGYSILNASGTITWFEIGGFLGIICAGWCSDNFFRGKRIPYMLYCTLVLPLVIWSFFANGSSSLIFDSFLMGALGFLIFGPQLLVGLAAAEFVNKKVACTANGFAGLFAYIGAAISGYPLGKVIDIWGWQGFFVVLVLSMVLNFICLISLVSGPFVFRSYRVERKPLLTR